MLGNVICPGRRVLLNNRKSVEVDGDHRPGMQQLHSQQRVLRTHGVIITDRDHRQVNTLIPDQAHVSEEAGVTGKVNLLPLECGEQEAARVAPVRTIRQCRAMQGEGHFEIPERMVKASTKVLRVGLEPLPGEPFADLSVGDDRGTGAFGDGDGITHVIAVSVRHEDVIRFQFFRILAGLRVACKVRIDQQFVPVGIDSQSGMAVPA